MDFVFCRFIIMALFAEKERNYLGGRGGLLSFARDRIMSYNRARGESSFLPVFTTACKVGRVSEVGGGAKQQREAA